MKVRTKATPEAWLQARLALLEKEKALTRLRDEVTRERQALPWEPVSAEYVFDSANGPATLRELFSDNDQLIVQHFMFAPDWTEGCPSCSFWADGFQGALAHLGGRGVSFVAVSQAPVERLEAYKLRMGWRHRWVSAQHNSFSNDFRVHYSPEQLAAGETSYNFQAGHHYGEHAPGVSIFVQGDDGIVYHTYSVYARGLDALNPTYQLLDLLPLGRDEDALEYPMAWVRRADSYG